MFSLVIPICNSYNAEDFIDRCKNMEIQLNLLKNMQIIVVEQICNYSYKTLLSNIKISINHPNLLYIQLFNPIFNKGWCINVGVKNSVNDHIIVNESDCIPYSISDYFIKLYDYIKENNIKWCIGWNKIEYLNENNTVHMIDTPRKGGPEGGLVFFEKEFYNSIGGFNEFMKELGGMDNCIIRRSERIHKSENFKWTIKHLYHKKSENMKPVNSTITKFRKYNIQLYNFIERNVEKATEYLKSKNFGNKEFPLCDKYNMLEDLKTITLPIRGK